MSAAFTRRIYSVLLCCMPREFRRRHAGEIERTLHEAGNGTEGARYGLGAVADLAWGLAAEWSRVLRRALLGDLRRDLRCGARALRRAPGFTLLATLGLALGMGANATVFSLVNEVLLRPLPVREPERLVNIYVDQPGANSFTGFSWPEFNDYRAARGALQDIAALSGTGLRYGDSGSEARISATFVSGNYFDLLGVTAARGRTFDDAQVDRSAAVAVVSHGFWQRRLGGRADVVGSEVRLSDVTFTIVGVLPAGFSGTFIGFPSEVWIPVTLIPRIRAGAELAARTEQPLELIGRLPEGGSVAAAEQSLDAIAAELEGEYPTLYRQRRVRVLALTGIDHSMDAGVSGFVGVLLALSGLVLLAACLNVGGMLLARGSDRAREMAVRAALGAPRFRLLRQLLVETILLFALGTAVALVVALQLNALLRRFIEALPLPLGFDLMIDGRVLLATLAVGLLTASLTGLRPALRVSDTQAAAALRTGARAGGRSQATRGAFVVGQVALSVLMLVCAGLFARAAARGARIDPGFDLDALSSATVGLSADRYDESQALLLFDSLANRLAASPLVDGVTFSTMPPIGVGRDAEPIRVPGRVDEDGDDRVVVDVNAVAAGYFEVVGVPLMEGRGFEAADGGGAGAVAVVNRSAAEAFWPGAQAVGRELLIDGERATVIGVAGDSRTLIQDAAPAPLVYLPAARRPARRMTVVVRGAAAAGELAGLLRAELGALDADLAPPNVAPLRDLLDLSLLPQRLAGRFAGGLGILALALAVSGVYGIVAYAVGCRRREVGIRVALGGAPRGLVLLMMRRGLALAAIGIALGALGVVALRPLLQQFLLDVSSFDPLALGGASGLMLLVAALASWVPARRVTRIDPVIALRAD